MSVSENVRQADLFLQGCQAIKKMNHMLWF